MTALIYQGYLVKVSTKEGGGQEYNTQKNYSCGLGMAQVIIKLKLRVFFFLISSKILIWTHQQLTQQQDHIAKMLKH